jgi:hypothetical protein
MTNAAVGADHPPVALDLPELHSTIVAHGDRKGNAMMRRQPNFRTKPLGADSPREQDAQHSIIACSPGDDGKKTIKTMGRQLA